MKTILTCWLPFSFLLASLLIAQNVAIGPNAASAGAAERAVAEINVRDLSRGRVIGVPGKPLGNHTIIDGVRAEGVMGSSPFAVSRIDGRTVSGPLCIDIRGAVTQKGTPYRLEGYESGGFIGYPHWSSPDAQVSFHFSSFFVVTKVIRPAE